jgi:hypothetical protein
MQVYNWRIVGGLSWEEVHKQLGGRYTAKGLRRPLSEQEVKEHLHVRAWIQAIE